MDHQNPEMIMMCKVCNKEFQLREEYQFDVYTNAYHAICAKQTNEATLFGSAHYQGSILLESIYFEGYITSAPPQHYAKGKDSQLSRYLYHPSQSLDCGNYQCKRHPFYETLKKQGEQVDD